MAINVLNVLVGLGGLGNAFELAWVADASTGLTLPTDTSTALASGFKSLGIIEENGTTENVALNTVNIDAYGAAAPVRVLTTSEVTTFKFTCRETRAETIALHNRLPIASVTPVGGLITTAPSGVRNPRYAIVFHATDGANVVRQVLPNAMISNPGSPQNAKNTNRMYDFEVTAQIDNNGVAVYTYYNLQSVSGS